MAAASTFTPFGCAGAARRDFHGIPGLNPFRYETHYVVREETLETLKRVAEDMALAERILGTLQKLSEPYGTEITVDHGVGSVEL